MNEQQQSSAVFASHIAQFFNNKETTYRKVSVTEYEAWKKQFSWDALYGMRYAQSFCNHFGIRDSILYHDADPVRADKYIKDQYLA
jgi:hypothetical protein